MRYWIRAIFAALGPMSAVIAIAAIRAQSGGQEGAQQQQSYQNMTPAERAARTRAFLGLGAAPDRAAAARGAPLYRANCAFCHGRTARGATAPSLITSDVVLGDDHGERLMPFLKKGRPENGMPAFAAMPERQLKDIAELLHTQVEDVANRGAYKVLNILVGDAAKGKSYVENHCVSCHTAETFAHIATRFHSPEQLQRSWIWPIHPGSVTAVVKSPAGSVSGRVAEISDFRIVIVDESGKSHPIDLGPGVDVEINDRLAAHQTMIQTLGNDDMHNVTAYLETLQ